MLKVAPVSTKYLSFVSSSIRKMSPALAGKCIAVAVACDGLAADRKWFAGKLVFRPSTGWSTPVTPVGVIIMKFAHAIARVLKGTESGWKGGVTFGAGVAAPFVASPPAVGSRLQKMMLPDILCCRFIRWCDRIIFIPNSESSFSLGSKDTSFSSLAISWAEHSLLKFIKNFPCANKLNANHFWIFKLQLLSSL